MNVKIEIVMRITENNRIKEQTYLVDPSSFFINESLEIELVHDLNSSTFGEPANFQTVHPKKPFKLEIRAWCLNKIYSNVHDKNSDDTRPCDCGTPDCGNCLEDAAVNNFCRKHGHSYNPTDDCCYCQAEKDQAANRCPSGSFSGRGQCPEESECTAKAFASDKEAR